jgi:hypothetical protein
MKYAIEMGPGPMIIHALMKFHKIGLWIQKLIQGDTQMARWPLEPTFIL